MTLLLICLSEPTLGDWIYWFKKVLSQFSTRKKRDSQGRTNLFSTKHTSRSHPICVHSHTSTCILVACFATHKYSSLHKSKEHQLIIRQANRTKPTMTYAILFPFIHIHPTNNICIQPIEFSIPNMLSESEIRIMSPYGHQHTPPFHSPTHT